MECRVKFFRTEGATEQDMTEICRSLDCYLEDKTILQTQIGNGDKLRTLCCSACENGSQFLVTMWNENFSHNNKIYALSIFNRAGFNLKTDTMDLKNCAIVGYPSFFWIIPAMRFIGVLDLFRKLDGRSNFENYLNNFRDFIMQKNGVNSIKFRAIYDPDSLDFVLKNHDRITKIIKSGVFTFQKAEECELWQKILRFFSNTIPYELVENTQKISLELNFTPTLNVLKKIIENWENELITNPSATLAFKLKNDHKIYRAGRMKITQFFDSKLFDNLEKSIPSGVKILKELQEKIDLSMIGNGRC